VKNKEKQNKTKKRKPTFIEPCSEDEEQVDDYVGHRTINHAEADVSEERDKDSWAFERMRSPRDLDNEVDSNKVFPQHNADAKF